MVPGGTEGAGGGAPAPLSSPCRMAKTITTAATTTTTVLVVLVVALQMKVALAVLQPPMAESRPCSRR